MSRVAIQMFMRPEMCVSRQNSLILTQNISKGKVHPRTGHERPEGKQRYSSALSLTSALDGVGGQRHPPGALHPVRPGTHCIGGWVGPKAEN